jgi:putative methionine-R-sulfoxide reductase with GAF domain
MPEDHGPSSCPSCKILRDELHAVNEFSQVIGSASDLDELYWLMADSIALILGVDDLVLYLRDGEMLIQKAAFGVKEEDRAIFQPIEIPIGSGIVGTAAATGIPQLVDDVSTFPGYIPDQYEGASELAVPVISENRVIGVFDTESRKKNNYQKKDRQLLERLSRIAAPRIQAATQRGRLEEAVVFLMEERQQSLTQEIRESGNIPLPGHEIGLFRLERLLALRERTTLWEANQTDLGRPVFLQILHRDKAASKQSIAFLERAQVASRLHHPNIAEVFGCGEDAGWFWTSQEHVPQAQLLSTFLDSTSRMPSLPEDYFSAVLWVFRRVADGIKHAHRMNVAHGNLTVEQLVLRPGEEPKIIGFGRSVEEGDPSAFAEDVVGLVEALYRALTFRPSDREKFVPPSLVRPECPIHLDALCKEALAGSSTALPTIGSVRESLETLKTTPREKEGGSFFRNWLGKFSGA